MFRFGIEHEVAFLDRDGQFVDFISSTFADLQVIIDQLPQYAGDEQHLRSGDAGIRVKRWYIEGFERFNPTGAMTACLPKGIEIRTIIHPTIQGAVDELANSFQLLRDIAARQGFVPVLTSYHPYRTEFLPNPPLNAYEDMLLEQSPEDRTSLASMLTYGPDLNFSVEGWSAQAIIDLGRKLTYYSPYIVPFSYSSPFYDGTVWEGLSVRTFLRTGKRPAALVFLADPTALLISDPSLTKLARYPAEIGRIEFKACDTCADFSIYAALLTLLKGLALDDTLPGRATTPDGWLHQLSARIGFSHIDILTGAKVILQAATAALREDSDLHFLELLYSLLQKWTMPAYWMLKTFQATKSIKTAMREMYTGADVLRHLDREEGMLCPHVEKQGETERNTPPLDFRY